VDLIAEIDVLTGRFVEAFNRRDVRGRGGGLGAGRSLWPIPAPVVVTGREAIRGGLGGGSTGRAPAPWGSRPCGPEGDGKVAEVLQRFPDQ
jgi:hypothetical protein